MRFVKNTTMKFFLNKIFSREKVARLFINPERIPQHIAIIMDGNGRWATKRGLPRPAGHRAGMERVRDIVDVCCEYNIKYLTLYAFSTENWKRPKEEVGFLMSLFEDALKSETEKLNKMGVKLHFIGLRENLSSSLLNLIEQVEKDTAKNENLTLNLAINYGGRSEITDAFKRLLLDVESGKVQADSIDESCVADYLFTAGQPDPDLLIKPGGEFRISNFLLWQLAYTEFYFTDKLWPDFGTDEFMQALYFFSKRERRFGGIKKQNEETDKK